ncbi:MAG TPA: hypothetical protein VFQ39_11755 [Longimicrobium sp.]|nr:hypothetical protein [Longimicrobium sp.]
MPLFRFVWFLALAALAVNVPLWRRRLRLMAADGALPADEPDRLTAGAVLALGLPSLGFAAIALLADWPSTACGVPLASPPVFASGLLTVVCWASLLAWLWLGGGAETLSRVSPALARRYPGRAWSPRRVRIAVTLLLAATLAGWTLAVARPNRVPTACGPFADAAPAEAAAS